jgi:hypothetical protein
LRRYPGASTRSVRIEDAAVGLIGVGIGAFVGWLVREKDGE